MSRRIAALVVMGITFGVGGAYAQDSNTTLGPGTVEGTYMPAGAAFFMSKDDSPSFGNYGFGTAVAIKVNRFIGIEGELGSLLATTSDLQFGDLDSDTKAPNMLSYTGNVVVSPWAVGVDLAEIGTHSSLLEFVNLGARRPGSIAYGVMRAAGVPVLVVPLPAPATAGI